MVQNPLLPSWYDLLWIGGSIVYAVLVITALVMVWRRRATLDATRTVVWCLIAIAVPIVFLVAWAVAGPKDNGATP